MVDSRVLHVTLLLIGFGAVAGALLALLVYIAFIPISDPLHSTRGEWLVWALRTGTAVGAVVGPVAAWTLMRHVPLWRAILETAVGALLGFATGIFFVPEHYVLAAVAGAMFAALRLRLSRRNKSAQFELPDRAG